MPSFFKCLFCAYLNCIHVHVTAASTSGSQSIYLSGFLTAVAVFWKPNVIPLCFSIDSVLNFLLSWLPCTPSIHIFPGHSLFLLSCGIHSIINFGILSSGILLMWPCHCSHFFSVMSMKSGFPFTPIISFICSFFIISILEFLADRLSTSSQSS